MNRFLLTAALATTAILQAQAPRATLEAMRGHQRALLVFSNGNNALAEEQLNVAAANIDGFHQRDLVLLGLTGTDAAAPTALLSAADDASARRRFHIKPGQFTVILIGKDGGEKLRSNQPIAWDELRNTIDSMPMRQQEMQAHPAS